MTNDKSSPLWNFLNIKIEDFCWYFRRPCLAKFKWKNKKLNPYEGECKLSIEVSDYLTDKTAKGELTQVWTKIANEGIQSMQYGALMRRMGKNSGVADFLIACSWGNLWIELKDTPKGKLSLSQVIFKTWCDHNENQHYHVRHNLEGVVELLKEYNLVQ